MSIAQSEAGPGLGGRGWAGLGSGRLRRPGSAGLAALAILFIFRFLPETKGRSVEETIGLFEPKVRPQTPPTAVGAH